MSLLILDPEPGDVAIIHVLDIVINSYYLNMDRLFCPPTLEAL